MKEQKLVIIIIAEKEDWEDNRQALDRIMWQTPLTELKNVLHAFEQQNGKSLSDEMWKLDDDKSYVYRTMCK